MSGFKRALSEDAPPSPKRVRITIPDLHENPPGTLLNFTSDTLQATLRGILIIQFLTFGSLYFRKIFHPNTFRKFFLANRTTKTTARIITSDAFYIPKSSLPENQRQKEFVGPDTNSPDIVIFFHNSGHVTFCAWIDLTEFSNDAKVYIRVNPIAGQQPFKDFSDVKYAVLARIIKLSRVDGAEPAKLPLAGIPVVQRNE